MVMTPVELADHLNSRVLLADHCGFDMCVIDTAGDLMSALFIAAVADKTGFSTEIGSDGDGEAGSRFWVVVSWR